MYAFAAFNVPIVCVLVNVCMDLCLSVCLGFMHLYDDECDADDAYYDDGCLIVRLCYEIAFICYMLHALFLVHYGLTLRLYYDRSSTREILVNIFSIFHLSTLKSIN